MIVNSKSIQNELDNYVESKLAENSDNILSTSDIINKYNDLIREHLIAGDTVRLPYAELSTKRRKVNTIMGGDIDFTYKLDTKLDQSIKDTLIKRELSQKE